MASKITPQDLARTGSEFGEQSAFFCWINAKEQRQRFPLLYRLSDGKPRIYGTFQNFTDAVKGVRAKQIGIKAGVADIFLPLPRHGLNGLYIELKRNPKHPANLGKKFKASDDQLLFRDEVREQGFAWALCMGWEEAAACVEQWLS